MGPTVRMLMLVLALLPLGGCRVLRYVFCRVEPPAVRSELTRDTPHAAVDFFVDALLSERVREMYESLHPDLVEELEGFSMEDFNGAFEAFKDEFAADAALLSDAERSPVTWRGGFALITLVNGDARITLVLQDRPSVDVFVQDEFLTDGLWFSRPFDPAAGLGLDDDRLAIATDVDLPDGLGLESADAVKRIELHHDWQLRTWQDAEGIGFLDRLAEETEEATE